MECESLPAAVLTVVLRQFHTSSIRERVARPVSASPALDKSARLRKYLICWGFRSQKSQHAAVPKLDLEVNSDKSLSHPTIANIPGRWFCRTGIRYPSESFIKPKMFPPCAHGARTYVKLRGATTTRALAFRKRLCRISRICWSYREDHSVFSIIYQPASTEGAPRVRQDTKGKCGISTTTFRALGFINNR